MASVEHTMVNPLTGCTRIGYEGFSWTTFFFCFFPAFIRGDFKWGFIQLILALLTYNLSSLVFMFLYNSLHLTVLKNNGYQIT